MMSIFNHKITLITLCGVALVGGIYAVKAHSATTPTPVKQELHLTATAPITSLDPARITDSVSANQLSQTGEGLYRLNAKSQPVNALARRTRITADGRHYTIDLRHDGRWSNGHPVTAQDFVYSWRRTLDPRTKSEFTYQFANIQHATAIAAGKLAPSRLGVRAHGRYQLRITLTKPASYFKQLLASTTYYPLDARAVQHYGNRYGTSAATTVVNGPYRVTGWTGTNDHWVLKQNPTYRDPHASTLKVLTYQVVKATSTGYNLYQAHKLDTVSLSGEQTRQNQHNPQLKSLAAGRIGFLQYNHQQPLTANRALRLALSLAVDRQQLTSRVLQDGSLPATTFAVRKMAHNPQTHTDFTHDATVPATTSYQPQLARQHFRQAQHQLHRQHIALTLLCADDDATKRVAEFLQTTLSRQLKGLTITVKAVPFPSMLSAVSQGRFTLNLTGWSMDFADPIQSLQILTATNNSNMGHYHRPTYDQAVARAEGVDALKPVARYHDLVQAAQTAMHDQAVTPLYDAHTSILVNPQLSGVSYNQFNGQADYRTARMRPTP